MTIGSWNPDVEASAKVSELTPELIAKLLKFAEQQSVEKLAEVLKGDEAQSLSTTIKLDHQLWLGAAQSLPDQSVLALIRFFALAENLPGWEAMEKSAVIPLAKTLRKRGAKLDKALLQWLRSVSTNRYLPYGPL